MSLDVYNEFLEVRSLEEGQIRINCQCTVFLDHWL